MSKKINANLYTKTKIVFENGSLYCKELENDCLYSKMRFPTKITPADLPKSFVCGRYYKNFGYLNSAGIKDLVYVPNRSFNHMHRDDSLYISYDKPIDKYIEILWGHSREAYRDYDYVIGGSYIIDFILAVRKYSDFDTTEIENALIEKAEWFMEKFPDEVEAQNGKEHIAYLKKIFNKE